MSTISERHYARPPVDGSLSVPEMFDWHYHHNPDHPLFVYPEDDGTTKRISLKHSVEAMHRAGRHYTYYFT
jgi:hypothetical protein